MRLKKVLVVYKKSLSAEHNTTLAETKRLLYKYDIKSSFILRESLNKDKIAGYGLIISVGGDGTLLRASHFIDDEIILGVNSDIKKSEGILCYASRHDLKGKIDKILDNKFSVKNLTRANVFFVNTKKSYTGLNEIYVGSLKSYHIARYVLNYSGIEEEQKSSGIIISTGTGSTAWYGSTRKERFNLEDKELRFVVREPYFGRLSKFRIIDGKIGENKKIHIKSKMTGGIVAVDSMTEIPFNYGEEIEISISKKPLRLISF